MSADSTAPGDRDRAPSTRDLARRLGVDGTLLERFADEHPSITAPVVLGWAEANPEHRKAVAAWLDARSGETVRRQNTHETDAEDGGQL